MKYLWVHLKQGGLTEGMEMEQMDLEGMSGRREGPGGSVFRLRKLGSQLRTVESLGVFVPRHCIKWTKSLGTQPPFFSPCYTRLC